MKRDMLKMVMVMMAATVGLATTAEGATTAQNLSLNLSGTVPVDCSFSVNSVAAAVLPATPSSTSRTLALTSTAETPTSIVVTCNDAAGYAISAVSSNNGKLVSGSNSINYKLDVNSATPATLSASPTTLLSKSSLATPESAVSYPIRVTYTDGVPRVPSGTYSDTVVFTLIGN